MTPTDDDRIRRLLDDAVADVEPRPGLDAIRSRTATRPRRGWAWGAGGAALATAATVAAVLALGGQGDRPGTSDAGPAGTTSTAPAPARAVYFVGDTGAGPRLFAEPHRPASAAAALDEAVDVAVSGRANDPDYRTPWPAGTTMQRAQLEAGVLSVDLSGPVADRPAGMTRAAAALAVQQLVYTAQATAGDRTPVTFLVDGRRTPTLLGQPTDRPVAAAAADDILAPVSVTSPVEGSTLSGPVTVEGRAAAFEANVQWELRRGDVVVRRGFATARECCTLSPYSFRFTAPSGDYTLVVHDEDMSGGEGVPLSSDSKDISIR